MAKTDAEFIEYVNTFESVNIRKYLALWYKILDGCDPFKLGRKQEPFINVRNGFNHAAILSKHFVVGNYLDNVEITVNVPKDYGPESEFGLKLSIVRGSNVVIASVEDDPAAMTKTKLESNSVERLYLNHIQAALDANSLLSCYFGVGDKSEMQHLRRIINLINFGPNP